MRLQQSVERYVEEKRATGMSFTNGNRRLLSFCRYVGDVSLDKIRPEQITRFLDGPRTSDLTWSHKYSLLRNFFLFWMARDLMRGLPMPPPRRPAKRTFVPYIYSQAEVRLLLRNSRVAQSNVYCRIDARTLRTFLLFLYGTGVLISEARRILREDVDFKRGSVVIRNSREQPSRTIPLVPDLRTALKNYSNSRHRMNLEAPHFFLDKGDNILNEATLNETFQRLRRLAGIARHDGIAHAPRMHDLRYTFAVHRLTAWYRHGADLNRMIPALSTYMGYMNLSGASRFLTLTPERFRTQLNKLSPRQGRRHWRDDPALMRFLSAL